MEKGVGLPQDILERFDCREQDVRNFSPLTLAYIGDCVYELIVRTMVVERGNRPPRKLHNESSEFSKAGTQRKIYEALLDEVTKEEADILRRGKNAHFHTKAKNATVLEALLGYLYLTGKMERVLELLKIGLRKCEMNL